MPTATRRRSTATAASTDWDFSKEEGGGGKRYKAGDYLAKVIKVRPVTSSEKKTPGIEVTLKLLEGKHKGETLTDSLWNVPTALWRTRALIEACGEDVPESAGDWKTIARLVLKKDVIITLGDDEYDGRIRSRVTDFLDPEEFDDEDTDDEDDEPEEEESDEFDEMDRSALRKVAKELGVTVKRAWSDDDLRGALREAEDEPEEEDEEEEEEAPAPKRRARKAKAKPKDDDDDLEGLDLDDI